MPKPGGKGLETTVGAEKGGGGTGTAMKTYQWRSGTIIRAVTSNEGKKKGTRGPHGEGGHEGNGLVNVRKKKTLDRPRSEGGAFKQKKFEEKRSSDRTSGEKLNGRWTQGGRKGWGEERTKTWTPIKAPAPDNL